MEENIVHTNMMPQYLEDHLGAIQCDHAPSTFELEVCFNSGIGTLSLSITKPWLPTVAALLKLGAKKQPDAKTSAKLRAESCFGK